MATDFSRTLSMLRKEQGISQRKVAAALGISQALLSHYENGIREPGLGFVIKVCDYYHVSADYLLGRTLDREGTTIAAEDLYDSSAEKGNVLRGPIIAMLQKKLVVNTTSMLFDLLGKVGNKEAIQEAAAYLGGALFKLYRQLYRAGGNEEKYMAVDSCAFNSGAVDADLHLSEAKYAAALEEAAKDGASFPDLGHDAMNAAYPGVHQSALQVFHAASERVNTSLGKK
ncbi:helix-turn-helix transcriptional regulator [bacterium 210917-DFI.7.65]|nr:helix-turn-helix domain-containing protein [Clostridiales bacterium]MCB6899707.1 helix-turn-helix transcriptional regulator [bacterium 210917-DFI.7.65]